MTASLTPDTLEAIEERAAKATEGPWFAASSNNRTWKTAGVALVGRLADRGTGKALAVFAEASANRHNDAAFTAAARSDVPLLLSEVRRLTGQRDAALELCDYWAKHGSETNANAVRRALTTDTETGS